MTIPFNGGCACGAFRYEVSAEPVMVGNCHCLDCKKASGSEMAVVVGVPRDSFKGQGDTKSFESTADSGKKLSRHFCPTCGSRLFTYAEAFPDAVMIQAGSMDDPSWIQPTMHIYTDRKSPWVHLEEGMVQFPGMPEH